MAQKKRNFGLDLELMTRVVEAAQGLGLMSRVLDAGLKAGITEELWEKLLVSDERLALLKASLEDQAEIRVVTQRWFEQHDVISMTLPPTCGVKGQEWFERLEAKGIEISCNAKQMLLSTNFRATKGAYYFLKAARGRKFWTASELERKTNLGPCEIFSRADAYGLWLGKAEMACAFCDYITVQEFRDMALPYGIVFPCSDVRTVVNGIVRSYFLHLKLQDSGKFELTVSEGDDNSLRGTREVFAFRYIISPGLPSK